MPPFGPVSRRDLIRCLRAAGYEGPYAGGKHQFMVRSGTTIRVPNPHRSDIGGDLLARILRQADISREQWEAL
jgi:predicted RNA binding protein YcfA (HicA-like mRNA interferase family)